MFLKDGPVSGGHKDQKFWLGSTGESGRKGNIAPMLTILEWQKKGDKGNRGLMNSHLLLSSCEDGDAGENVFDRERNRKVRRRPDTRVTNICE